MTMPTTPWGDESLPGISHPLITDDGSWLITDDGDPLIIDGEDGTNWVDE